MIVVTGETHIVHLSRRNLLTLLSKLDRRADGDATTCSIVKVRQDSPFYPQTMRELWIVAVDDEEYYSSQARPAGKMHKLDEVNLTVPSTGKSDSTTLN